MTPSESIDLSAARRLALLRAGLAGNGVRAAAHRDAAHGEIERFGYLQLDTVSVAGARSHALVLLARIDGLDPKLAADLLVPGAPLFEYWGHEACWMPLDLWPVFEFRRTAHREGTRWAAFRRENRKVVDEVMRRARDGAFRSSELEGKRGAGWWDWKPAKLAAESLWRTGDLAIRDRRGFQRTYDLAERVIPERVRARHVDVHEAYRTLILLAFAGHGWAETRTIADTFRLRRSRPEFVAAMRSLADERAIVACSLQSGDGALAGWIRREDLELAARLDRTPPSADRSVLLTPFDPLLWDRARVRLLFGFEQVLEIYKPAATRRFGYFCLPVLAGERLVARVDVKARRKDGVVDVLACHFEAKGRVPVGDRDAARRAIARHAASLGLAVRGGPRRSGRSALPL
jgi:uncharacterized protein YcaQ